MLSGISLGTSVLLRHSLKAPYPRSFSKELLLWVASTAIASEKKTKAAVGSLYSGVCREGLSSWKLAGTKRTGVLAPGPLPTPLTIYPVRLIEAVPLIHNARVIAPERARTVVVPVVIVPIVEVGIVIVIVKEGSVVIIVVVGCVEIPVAPDQITSGILTVQIVGHSWARNSSE